MGEVIVALLVFGLWMNRPFYVIAKRLYSYEHRNVNGVDAVIFRIVSRSDVVYERLVLDYFRYGVRQEKKEVGAYVALVSAESLDLKRYAVSILNVVLPAADRLELEVIVEWDSQCLTHGYFNDASFHVFKHLFHCSKAVMTIVDVFSELGHIVCKLVSHGNVYRVRE